MERKVTKLEKSHVEVLVTVDQASWAAAQKKAFNKEAANVTVKGFRKGKAPMDMVKAKVDQVKVMNSAIDALLPEIYRDILDNEDIRPFAQPKVDVTKLSDTELEVKFTMVTAPEVKLGTYTGLKVGKKEVKVEEKDVDAAIESLRKENATLVVKEGAAEKGDIVVMDFAGTVDGKAFDGGSATNHELELGSGQFIPGFEDQLIGAKSGDHVDVKVKFPENYTPELKGKDAVFACDVHEVKSKKLPELNDEFVAELKLEGVKTVANLRESKKVQLKAQKEGEARREYIDKLMDMIIKDSTVEIADEIVDNQVESRKKDVVNRMTQSGLTLEQYLSIVGQTEEQFMAKLKEDSRKDITGYMIIETIGTKEKMEVNDAELEFEFAKIADQYKMSVDDVKKALGPQVEEFRNNIKMQRIEDFLVSHND